MLRGQLNLPGIETDAKAVLRDQVRVELDARKIEADLPPRKVSTPDEITERRRIKREARGK